MVHHDLSFAQVLHKLKDKYPNNKNWRIFPNEKFEIENDLILVEC